MLLLVVAKAAFMRTNTPARQPQLPGSTLNVLGYHNHLLRLPLTFFNDRRTGENPVARETTASRSGMPSAQRCSALSGLAPHHSKRRLHVVDELASHLGSVAIATGAAIAV